MYRSSQRSMYRSMQRSHALQHALQPCIATGQHDDARRQDRAACRCDEDRAALAQVGDGLALLGA